MKYACALFLLVGCAHRSVAGETPTPEDPEPIVWRAFGPAAFEEARREGKLLLVDVGIEGCTACRWMAEATYTDPAVLRRVHRSFVPVAVDADARPDLGERWSRWGWPATIVLGPDGERLLAVRGSRRPRNFVPILDGLLAAREAGTLEPETDAPLPDAPAEGALERACEETRDALHAAAERAGSFVMVRGAPVQLAFLRAETRGQELGPALRTAESWQRLLDPVWGGVFVAGAEREGRLAPIPEKRLLHNAAALEAFATVFAQTGDPSARQAAAEVHRYVRDWLTDPAGGFYATQEDDAPDLPEGMSAAAYYALDDAGRREFGIPPIDHAIYTDLNARMIAAYAQAAQRTRDDTYLSAARRAAEGLAARRTDAGWLRQVEGAEAVAQDDRMRALAVDERPYLRTQAWAIVALTALYDASEEARWLELARGVADATVSALRTEAGAFHSAPRDPDDPLAPHFSLSDHAVLARGMLRLSALSGEPRYADLGRETLRAVARPGTLARRGPGVLGEVGLALEHALLGPVEISLVAEPQDPAAHPLRDAARQITSPRRVVHFEPDGRYPRQETPVAYVCTAVACSSPVADPARLADVVAQLSRRDGAACGPR